MKRSSLILIAIILLIPLGLLSCKSTQSSRAYPFVYLQALQDKDLQAIDNEIELDDLQQRFTAVFDDLEHADLHQAVGNLYAERLYFSDSLELCTTRYCLIEYLQRSRQRLNQIEAQILDIQQSGQDIYVRWTLLMDYRAGFSDITTMTVGMSHLRVNAQGLIVLQQDFWDGAEGVYRYLPIIGNWLPGTD